MCSVSTNGERVPSTTTRLSADRMSFFLLTTLVDKHAHILVKSLSNCQELVHISVFLYRLAHSSKAISY